jgi:hypothetical protein
MREFEVEDWASGLSKEVVEHLQQAILMGAKYKELYEKLLYEKNILISCLCSGKADVIGLNNQVLGEDGKRRQVTTYHVRVKALDSDEEAVWGMDAGELSLNYSCHSPYSAVQYMLAEMKKWEETK